MLKDHCFIYITAHEILAFIASPSLSIFTQPSGRFLGHFNYLICLLTQM